MYAPPGHDAYDGASDSAGGAELPALYLCAAEFGEGALSRHCGWRVKPNAMTGDERELRARTGTFPRCAIGDGCASWAGYLSRPGGRWQAAHDLAAGRQEQGLGTSPAQSGHTSWSTYAYPGMQDCGMCPRARARARYLAGDRDGDGEGGWPEHTHTPTYQAGAGTGSLPRSLDLPPSFSPSPTRAFILLQPEHIQHHRQTPLRSACICVCVCVCSCVSLSIDDDRGRVRASSLTEGMSAPPSPMVPQPHRRSNMSSNSAPSAWATPPQTPGTRNSYSHSRRSSQSSVRTVATTYSLNSSATSTSVTSAKFERAFANQSQKWTSSVPAIVRHPSLSSQYSIASVRNVPPHVVGKRSTLQKQLKVVEALLRDTVGLVLTETGSVGWLLAHERYLLNVAIKYDERATSEWEASQDWYLSAQEGPVSKIFVTQPSRFGLTPEQHKHRIGQARKLGDNALDLWRFSDLNYQDAFKIRGAREKLQLEQQREAKADVRDESGATDEERGRTTKKDFQTWLKEVSKNNNEAMQSVFVKDDGRINFLAPHSVPEDRQIESPGLSRTPVPPTKMST